MALKKVINSATQQFEPVLVDKLVLDAVPTVNSFNSVTSDAVARAVAGASGEVPAVTESDNGKVLKAIYDEGGAAVEWGEAAPAVTVDQTYNALSENPQSGTAVAGAIATVKQVPASTASDSSKVLTVNASGNPEWQTAQGGGSSYTAGDGIEIDNGEISVGIAKTLDIVPAAVTTTYTAPLEGYVSLPQALRSSVLSSNAELTIQFPQDSFWSYDQPTKPVRIGVTDGRGNYLVSSEVSLTYYQNGSYSNLNAQTVTVSCPASNWEYSSGSSISAISEMVVIPADSNGMGEAFQCAFGGNITFTLAQPDPNKNVVTVKNPLPASTSADANKVLTVNSNGAAGWQPVDEVPDVTSSDDGKVLTAAYSGGTGSYSWQPGVHVIEKEKYTTKSSNIYTYTVANTGLYSVTIMMSAVNIIDTPVRVTIGSGQYVYKDEELSSSGDINVSLIRQISANTQLDIKFYDGSSNIIAPSTVSPRITLIQYA